MDAGPSRQPDGDGTRRRNRRAAWCAGAGVILAAAAVACSLAGVISAPQAVAICVPAALLVIGGVAVAAIPDAATARLLGFRAGWRTGSLLNWWRSLFGRRPNSSLAVIGRRGRRPILGSFLVALVNGIGKFCPSLHGADGA
jgi:hypothetical protein